ncbi:hypothetical protein AB0L82_13245 [Nocardia sp. NPDC052001]|uniref:hypothetical protein n=1 Tax=Nocardia sp. NPDC052001 TaxID=3154853 RepID=UPI00343B644F
MTITAGESVIDRRALTGSSRTASTVAQVLSADDIDPVARARLSMPFRAEDQFADAVRAIAHSGHPSFLNVFKRAMYPRLTEWQGCVMRLIRSRCSCPIWLGASGSSRANR